MRNFYTIPDAHDGSYLWARFVVAPDPATACTLARNDLRCTDIKEFVPVSGGVRGEDVWTVLELPDLAHTYGAVAWGAMRASYFRPVDPVRNHADG